MEDIQRQNREQLQIISELRQLALVSWMLCYVYVSVEEQINSSVFLDKTFLGKKILYVSSADRS